MAFKPKINSLMTLPEFRSIKTEKSGMSDPD